MSLRKNLKNVVAIGITISVINASIVPVFAADNTESSNVSGTTISYNNGLSDLKAEQNGQATKGKQVLKLDDAIKGAIDNSEDLSLKSDEIRMYQDKEKLQDKYNDFYQSLNQKVYDYDYDKLEDQEKQAKQSEDFVEDQIKSDITNKYNDMVLQEIDIDKSKKDLELENNDLNYLKGKLALGMATPNDVNDTQINIKSLQDEITAKENALSDDEDYFKVLTDYDLKNTYTLDYDMDYTKFKIDGSIDNYIDDRLNSYFEYDDKIIDLTKDYMKDLKDDGIKDIMDQDIPTAPNPSNYTTTDANGNTSLDSGQYALSLIDYEQKELTYYTKLESYGSYIDGKYNYDESKVKLDDTKKNLKNVLKENYSTLLDLENKIDTLKEQVNSTDTKLKFAKAQVDMGLMLQNDYDKQVLASEDLNTTLRKLVYTHNNLMDSIEKPWILSNQ
jgi:hypothetical protein